MEGILRMSDSAASCSLPGSSALPSPMTTVIHLMNRVHCLYRWKMQVTEVYTNSRNLKLLIAGHLVNGVAGENTLLRIASQIVLVTARIVDLGKQKIRTYEAYCDVLHAIFTLESHWVSVKILRDQPSLALKFLGEDYYIWAIQQRESFFFYVRRIALCASILFTEMLKTSMCYMDVIEAFSINSATHNDAVNHLFINTTKLLDGISENKQTIHAELLKHKGLIKQVLGVMGTQYQAETLIGEVAKTLNHAERTYNGVKWVFESSEDGIRDGLSSLCISCLGWTPGFLLPEDPNPLKGFAVSDVAVTA